MLHAIAGIAIGTVIALVSGALVAQEYPVRPVKIIVPCAAGGPADVYARFSASACGSAGQPFVVDDRPGRLDHRHRCRRQKCGRWLYAVADVEHAFGE